MQKKIKKWTKVVVDDVKKDWKWYLCWLAIGVIISWAINPFWKVMVTIILLSIPIYCITEITRKEVNREHHRQNIISHLGCPSD